jgi:pleiotropic regulator 1
MACRAESSRERQGLDHHHCMATPAPACRSLSLIPSSPPTSCLLFPPPPHPFLLPRSSAGDNGSLWFWDWTSGHCFQQTETQVQPGSLESESGIYATAFDMVRALHCTHSLSLFLFLTHDPIHSPPFLFHLTFSFNTSFLFLSQTGSRLITCEADKTIKMWKEDENATPENSPGLPFRPPKDIRRF